MLFVTHKAGKVQQRLAEAAGIKLLTRSKQFFYSHKQREECVIGGTVSLL